MGFHHVAIAIRDLDATHRFYTESMGFELVKVVAAPTPDAGWARHLFYDTGGGEMIAFWDLHDATYPDFDPSISRGLGLPEWTNHIAFDAQSLDAFDSARERWLEHGHRVAEIDHGWCRSIYVTDPNEILVEFCVTTRVFSDTDRAEALALLRAEQPPLETAPRVVIHEPTKTTA
jgi:catechol 2,3-dioxygenase-like lactoylglutathione lyase family enzyme